MLSLALPLAAISGSSASTSAVLAADGAVSSGGTALYAMLGGIVVALITAVGGVLAVRSGRALSGAGNAGDEAMTRLLTDAYTRVDALHVSLDAAQDEGRLWQSRAEKAGWTAPP